MGEKNVSAAGDERSKRDFTNAVLNDLAALEEMIASGAMETGVARIGAEQEMFLVDSSMHPSPTVMEVLDVAGDPRLTTEIGKFNIEANLTPLEFHGDCLSRMEAELSELVGLVRSAMEGCGGNVVLCGILPTIQLSDLVAKNLTPIARYRELDRVLNELHGGERLIHIKGVDELQLQLSDTSAEFCNSSFQVHLQVDPGELANHYNWAQVIAAPVLAAAVNSPLLLGHRLWSETRLALFQHAVDERSQVHQERGRMARVTFGRSWVNDSILEVFHEDVARFRILLTRELEGSSTELLRSGNVPELSAWRLHNGTVWRWNRGCYGVLNSRPSLRIEARFLPAGPTVLDEVANAAFLLGLMKALPEEFGDVRERFQFDDAKSNFLMAARFGTQSQLRWLDGKDHQTKELILEELLPFARKGLESAGVDPSDVDRYLNVVEERVESERTGSRWIVDSLAGMDPLAKKNVRMRTLTEAMIHNQESGAPVSKWPLAEIPATTDWIDNYKTVEQFMSTDLFTVSPEDPVALAANLMEWKHLRHVPVEDEHGKLVGIVSYKDMLKLLSRRESDHDLCIRDIMQSDLLLISPETSGLEALLMMREKEIGCLPIVRDDKLIGMVTAYDFLTVSARLFEERLRKLEQSENGRRKRANDILGEVRS